MLTFAELDAATAYDVWRLRQQVFVVEQGSPYPDLDGRDGEPAPDTSCFEADGAFVGYARVLDDGDVGADRPGRGGAGRPRPRVRRPSWCAPRSTWSATATSAGRPDRVAGWYASYGFEVTGPEFDDDGVMHLPMARKPAG